MCVCTCMCWVNELLLIPAFLEINFSPHLSPVLLPTSYCSYNKVGSQPSLPLAPEYESDVAKLLWGFRTVSRNWDIAGRLLTSHPGNYTEWRSVTDYGFISAKSKHVCMLSFVIAEWNKAVWVGWGVERGGEGDTRGWRHYPPPNIHNGTPLLKHQRRQLY